MKKTEEEIGLAATSNCNPYELMIDRGIDGDYIRNDEVCKLIWDAWRQGAKWMQEQDNKWIKLNSVDDLPKEPCGCWIFDKPTQSIILGRWENKACDIAYWLENASHYIPVYTPEPPKH